RFVVPLPAETDQPAPAPPDDKSPTRRCTWVPFIRLMKDALGIDVERCLCCGDKMKLVRVITSPAAIARILRQRGEPTEPEPLAPARAPPYYKSHIVRRKAADLIDDDLSGAERSSKSPRTGRRPLVTNP